MKKFAIVLAGTVMLAACGGEKDKSADVELKTEIESVLRAGLLAPSR